MGISLAGLSSGLDTNALIEGLMSVERAPRSRLTLQQASVQARQDLLKQVGDKLKALKLASDSLSSAATWGAAQSATTSDATIGTGRVVAGAAPGTHVISVTQLATAEQRTYTYSAKTADRSVDIGGQNLTITANSSLNTVVNQINGNANYGVYAVNSGGALVLTSRTTGQAVNLDDFGSTIFTEQTAKAKPFKNATGTIDGVAFTSPTNTFDENTAGAAGAITGVELTLAKVGSFNLDITPPAIDKTVVTSKVKAFIDAYNSAVDFMNTKVSEKRVPNAATNTDAAKGALWADSSVNGILQSMRSSISTFMQGGNTSLNDEMAEIGISTGVASGTGTFSQDSVNGKLVFDEAQFTTMINTDPNAVQRLMGGMTGTDGFAQAFSGVLSPYTQAGGVLDSRVEAATSEMKRLTDSLARMDDRLAAKQEYWQKIFTNLEVALQKSKSQGSELLAKLGVSNDS